MTDYVVKLRFWLRAYDSNVISAATDAEAFHLAKAMARHMMTQTRQPEEIDIEERREGLLSYIDRLDDDRRELTDARAIQIMVCRSGLRVSGHAGGVLGQCRRRVRCGPRTRFPLRSAQP